MPEQPSGKIAWFLILLVLISCATIGFIASLLRLAAVI